MGVIKAKKRQKMCYNCEGDVDLDVIVCPFCAADLRAERPEQVKGAYSPSVHSLKNLGGGALPSAPPVVENPLQIAEEEPTFQSAMPQEAAPDKETSFSMKEALLIGLLSLGAIFIDLGLILLLFSEGGTLILQWDATWWFIYLILGGGAVFAGIKLLSKDT